VQADEDPLPTQPYQSSELKSYQRNYFYLENAFSCLSLAVCPIIGEQRIAANASTVGKTATEGTRHLSHLLDDALVLSS